MNGVSARAAIGLGVLLVAAAIGLGLGLGRLARPPEPTPRHVSVTAPPTPSRTPVPVDVATLFSQPVSAACATAQSVWVVTNGGGLLRYDGTAWAQVDDTLRSLDAVTCSQDRAIAVGLVGTVVLADEAARQINATDVSVADLFGVSTLSDGALMVGAQGNVFLLNNGEIQPFAAGIDEDLHDVVAFSLESAWAVGQDGITYRLDRRGWNPVGSGQTKTLLAVAATTPADAVAVGEGGIIVRYDGGWQVVKSDVTTRLRDVIVKPALWIAGDQGTLLTGTAGSLRAIDLHTQCDLVSVFSRGSEIWVLGSATAGGGGLWQLTLDGAVAQHWGGC